MEYHTKDKAWDEHGCFPQQILNDMKIRGAGEHQRDGPQYGDVKFAAEKLPRRSSSAAGKGAAERRSNEVFIHKEWNSQFLCGVREASRFDPMKGRMSVFENEWGYMSASPRRGGLHPHRGTSWSCYHGDRGAQGVRQGRQTIDSM